MSNDRGPCLKGHWLWGNLKDFNADNLSFIESAARQGDLVRLRFGPMRGYFVNHPDYVCKVLAARSKSFRKPAVVQRALVDILGENIFTSNGAAWKQRRQALQPAFHLRHVERYTQIMLDCARRELRDWRAGNIIDLEASMIRVTMNIIVKAMFDADLGSCADEITAVFTRLFHLAYRRMAMYALAADQRQPRSEAPDCCSPRLAQGLHRRMARRQGRRSFLPQSGPGARGWRAPHER